MLDIDLHRTKLLRLLKDIYSDNKLRTVLGFKGGTAAYFFYDLSRFSVDLDFDLLQEDKGPEVYSRLQEILINYGEFKDMADKRKSYLLAVSHHERYHNIKVEVYKEKSLSKYELKSYQGISMQVMVKEDMLANKLLALKGRNKTATRDFYDVWYFLSKSWDFNEQIIESKIGTTAKEYLNELVEFVKNYNDKNILNGLGYLLNEKQKHWVKTSLKKELLFELELRLER